MFVYYEKDIRTADNLAIEQGFSINALMENAGRGLFEKIKQVVSKSDQILLLSGRGNNGGDGIVLARYLKQHGYNAVLIFPFGEPSSETAKHHLDYFRKQGFTIENWSDQDTYDVVIDCLLGIGTILPLRENANHIISWCNQLDAKKIAVDLPTGTTADSGETGIAFQADYTFSLHGVKPSAFLLPSSDFYGISEAVDIGLKHTSTIRILDKDKTQRTFPKRDSAAHKGTFGSSLLIAGSNEMPGSALLGAIGAIRSGAGRLFIATSKLAASIIAPRVPEATYMLDGLQQVIDGNRPKKLASVAIGPGIEDEEKVHAALIKLMEWNIPLVVDAGALVRLKNWKRPNRDAPIILTPHPGEFSRLTDLSIKDIQTNRIKVAQDFSIKNDVTVVLKGQYTVIAYPDGNTFINSTGNSGLSKGGSGDILTGMIVSMLATHTDWQNAVTNAVFIHGLCADQWKTIHGETSMTASDFDTLLPIVLREIEG